MSFKVNLHFHTADDPRDTVAYSFEEAIERAARLGFHALALSCHERVISKEHYVTHAAARGILLIPGVERDIEGRHVVILNVDRSIEQVATFTELARYKSLHPDIFILAPHPYFPGDSSLMELFKPHIALFDAVELSWFYAKHFNPFNRRAERVAKTHHLPVISTSDTHDLRWLDTNYALVDAEEKTSASLFRALREGRFRNVSLPRSFMREILPLAGRILCERMLRFVKRKSGAPMRRPT